jgi:hypothetical protein
MDDKPYREPSIFHQRRYRERFIRNSFLGAAFIGIALLRGGSRLWQPLVLGVWGLTAIIGIGLLLLAGFDFWKWQREKSNATQ